VAIIIAVSTAFALPEQKTRLRSPGVVRTSVSASRTVRPVVSFGEAA